MTGVSVRQLLVSVWFGCHVSVRRPVLCRAHQAPQSCPEPASVRILRPLQPTVCVVL